jgi:hypothetical protein
MDHGYTDGITVMPKKTGLLVSEPALITATLDDCWIYDYNHIFFIKDYNITAFMREFQTV